MDLSDLVLEFRARAARAGAHLAAEAAWHAAADMLADALKQQRAAARKTPRRKALGLRITR